MQNEAISRWVDAQMPASAQDAARTHPHHPKQAVPSPEQDRVEQQPVCQKSAASSPPQIHSEISPQQRTGTPNSTSPPPPEQPQQQVNQRPLYQDEPLNGGPPPQQREDLINQEPARADTPNNFCEFLTRPPYLSRQDISPKFDVQSRSSRPKHSEMHRKPDRSDSPDGKALRKGEAPTRKKILTHGTSFREHFSHVFDSSYIKQGLFESANSSKKKGGQSRRQSHSRDSRSWN